MKKHEFKIAVLMPSRGRTDAFSRSLFSLVDRADDLSNIQFIIGLDNDDTIGLEHFSKVIQPRLDEKDAYYSAMEFTRLGYERLNVYYNTLATQADADWLFVWCDDAINETDGWDSRIIECTGEFKLLKVHTHNEHPYSIFPIVPSEWMDITGYISKHQLIDAEVSQMAYLLDIMKIIEINVTHDRVDLTGNNADDTSKNKKIFEGNPSNPYDFHNLYFIKIRNEDTLKVAQYMESKELDISWFKKVVAKEVDPWEKMKKNDPNNQTLRYDIVKNQKSGDVAMIPRQEQ